jgi:hypothetical protein
MVLLRGVPELQLREYVSDQATIRKWSVEKVRSEPGASWHQFLGCGHGEFRAAAPTLEIDGALRSRTLLIIATALLGTTRFGRLVFRVITSGGGASKSQPLPIPGQGVYLGERKLSAPTCRDDVVAAVEALTAGGGESAFTVETVHAAMVLCGSPWSRETVAKTMLRMTRPARRPPYLQLDRAGRGWYRVGGCVPSHRLGR